MTKSKGTTTNTPNVLFIMVDQLNHKCLGYAGNTDVITPNLDSLRRDSVNFSRCYVQNAFCAPSRTCYNSSQYLFHNRQYGFTGLLAETTPNMVATFQKSGYHTVGIGKIHLSNYGENLGFDTIIPTLPEDIYHSTDPNKNYQSYLTSKGYSYPSDQVHGDNFREKSPTAAWANRGQKSTVGVSDIPAKHSIESYAGVQAEAFLQDHASEPFFMHLSFDRPHGPWTPSPEFLQLYSSAEISLPQALTNEQRQQMPVHIQEFIKSAELSIDQLGEVKMRKLLKLYYAMITHIDHEIGRVINKLKNCGIYNNTAIIFCSDHGDMAGYKGLFNKYSNRIYHDSIIRTPLLMKLPDQEGANTEIEHVVESINLFPTLTEICGIPLPSKGIDGRSLLPLILEPKSTPWSEVAFSESYSIKTIIKDNWKLIYYVNSSQGELYDLSADPLEYKNLYAESGLESLAADLKLEIVKKMTDHVSDPRKRYIRGLFNDVELDNPSVMTKTFKWDRGVVDGGGFWMVARDEYRLVYLPFDNRCIFEKLDQKEPNDGARWNYLKSDDQEMLHSLIDELLNFISTKIRPISILIGSQQDRDNMLKTKGFGLC